MCGRLNVSDDPFVIGLVESLGVEAPQREMQFSQFTRVATPISIIREVDGARRLDNATWWLLLEHTETSFKPSKYISFNTRYDKLNVPRSAGYKAFRESSCIVPAKGVGKTERSGDSLAN